MADRWNRPLYRRFMPDRDVTKHLSPGEEIKLQVGPSKRTWFFEQWDWWGAAALVFLIFVVAADVWVTKAAILMWGVIAVRLLVRGLQIHFTRYTLTDHRAIRQSGVLEDRLEWMSWRKVTDVSVHRTFGERLTGTATIFVQSANEASGFKAMHGIHDHRFFAQKIADLVNKAHGPILLDPDHERG